MDIRVLWVTTIGNNELFFENEDAKSVLNAINDAGAIGAKWTTPIKVSDGRDIVLVVNNIAFFEFK